MEVEEEGKDAGVEEDMPVVIAFRDDGIGRFRFLSFLASVICSTSLACRFWPFSSPLVGLHSDQAMLHIAYDFLHFVQSMVHIVSDLLI